ncbi:hypothetical protein FHS68_002170 [Dyadobacter arcticus]|uniref:Uncharacterized protein n=1 Tax=Dyadobacter arcticus TaxID=1078754 RepID=A0ABX0UNG3_9BACT|nr:hypothetical protein [Dyadobacter arcticus]
MTNAFAGMTSGVCWILPFELCGQDIKYIKPFGLGTYVMSIPQIVPLDRLQ